MKISRFRLSRSMKRYALLFCAAFLVGVAGGCAAQDPPPPPVACDERPCEDLGAGWRCDVTTYACACGGTGGATSCGPTESCDPDSGTCVDRCRNVTCNFGQVCDGTTGQCQMNFPHYLKASNAGASDFFGHAVSLSGDTLAVGVPQKPGQRRTQTLTPRPILTTSG